MALTFTTRDGVELALFDHPYNVTAQNERAVEVPLAMRFIGGRTGGIEVGNVMGHYVTPTWAVVDRYEQADDVLNVDIVDVRGAFSWVLAISTVEHIGWDDHPRDESKALDAIEVLKALVAPGGDLMMTIPSGHHLMLDEALPDLGFDIDFYRRRQVDGVNRWTIAPYAPTPYAWDEHTANGVAICTWRR